MKTRLILAVILAAAIARTSAAVEPTNADQVLTFSITKTSGYNAFSTDVTQTMNMLGAAMKINGHMIFKQPTLMRYELDMPMMGQTQKMLMVLGADKVMWQEMNIGELKRVMKFDYQKNSTNSPIGAQLRDALENVDPKRQLEAAREKYNFKLAGTTKVDGQAVYILEGRLRANARLNPQETAFADYMGMNRMYIGQQDGFMHRMEVFDKSGTNLFMSMETKNLKVNEAVPDELFVYKPAAGVQVIDMADMMKQMMGGTQPPTEPEPSNAAPERKPTRP